MGKGDETVTESYSSFHTQEFSISVGPQHPSTHGVYRAVMTFDGEKIVKAENVVGYLHRGLEKIAESRTVEQFLPYTDRVDYVSALIYNIGYAQTIEKLMEIEVPERAEYIRVIMAELQRISSHLVFIGSFAMDLASTTGWMYCFREREKILDLIEMVAGSRITTNYARIGGVAADLPNEFIPLLKKVLPELKKSFDELDGLLTGNEILQARSKGIGKLKLEQALDYGITGPNLRACGSKLDLRKVKPYGIYDRFDFEIPIRENGDTFDRFVIRLMEMEQSVRIIEQAIDALPEGPIKSKAPKILKVKGEYYHRVESTRGIVGFYLVGDGSRMPVRLHIHAPSFVNIAVYPEIIKGETFQDAIATLASIDFVLGEVDR